MIECCMVDFFFFWMYHTVEHGHQMKLALVTTKYSLTLEVNRGN